MATMTMDKTDNLEELRRQYAKLRRNALYGATREAWNHAVTTLALRRAKKAGLVEPTAEIWVASARDAVVECEYCGGSGRYSWGPVTNGKPAHTGDCYRCTGKGVQDQEDFTRNWAYDRHRKVI
jgi:hypothetical protein